jgi:hypothetical protein
MCPGWQNEPSGQVVVLPQSLTVQYPSGQLELKPARTHEALVCVQPESAVHAAPTVPAAAIIAIVVLLPPQANRHKRAS